MRKHGTFRTIILGIITLSAVLASVWAVMAWRYRGDPLLFVDGLLPKRSLEAFNYETSLQVQEDVLIAHERGVTIAIIPFIVSTALWFGAFVVSMLWRKTEESKANNTLDGSSKQSM
ncbi:MAG: hypothetical protein WAW23_03530, partial [Candidatus Methanoperedens sp.]